jgi:RHS repeat-associated protein
VLIQETVWLGDMPVATLRPNGAGGVNVFYVHTDHLDTPRLVTDSSNNIRWRWDSDPFGSSAPNENPSSLGLFDYNLRFPGQQYDAVVGLHYNYFRDYDPAIGSYVQSDPMGLAGGSVNTYGYTNGNPIEYSDPTGEFIPQLFGFVLGAGLEYLTNPCASTKDLLIAGGIGALGGGLSKAAFLRFGPKSLTRETGKEWSHSIGRKAVNRWTTGWLNKALNRRGGYNGSWTSPKRHYKHDPSRSPKGWGDFGRRFPLPLQVLDRIPDWAKGTVSAGAAGAAVAGSECECQR